MQKNNTRRMDTSIKDIDSYIALYPPDVRKRLEAMRATISKAAPEAGEKISYGIPTFTLNGNLVHFGGFAHHVGFYPGPKAIVDFQKELAKYETSKGAVQFPHDKPLPLALVTKMVKHRVKEAKAKAKAKEN